MLVACTTCPGTHRVGERCPQAIERDRERWREQSRRRGPRPYNTKRWRELAAAAKKRDGYRCRACGGTERLQGHHVDPDPDRFFECENVVTLCVSCHREDEWRRRWAASRGERPGRAGYRLGGIGDTGAARRVWRNTTASRSLGFLSPP